MYEVIGYVSFSIYTICLLFIVCFCLMQLHLLAIYLRKQRKGKVFNRPAITDDWPIVTIQLPVFNERYVIRRLIDRCCEIQYPRDKLEIQVLDDSTDETRALAAERIAYHAATGNQIVHITRKDRKGYKAGALQAGLAFARGEFIAIFDADFLPATDFLLRVIPAFHNPRIAVVQTRWAHLNEDYSLMTRLQAMHLNLHFSVEQTGRQEGNFFLQFNGTAGIWRKSGILDAGGWSSDTLTEDLDLSYRAQLKGWKIHYLEDIGSPAELPVHMSGLKSQQYRWMKGGAETAKKLIPRLMDANLPVATKGHAVLHLLSSSVFLAVFLIGIVSVPLSVTMPMLDIPMAALTYPLIATLAVAVVYFTGNVLISWKEKRFGQQLAEFVVTFPLFLSFTMGLSLHNSRAVLQGYIGKQTPFIRTPKFNILQSGDHIFTSEYFKRAIPATTIAEGILCLYFVFAALYGLYTGYMPFLVFHLMLAAGYGAIFYYSIQYTISGKHDGSSE